MTNEQRLDKLEMDLAAANRRNRWLIAIVGMVVCGVGLSWVFAVTSGTAQASRGNDESQIIRAAGFVLVDDQGWERGGLICADSTTRLALRNATGHYSTTLV